MMEVILDGHRLKIYNKQIGEMALDEMWYDRALVSSSLPGTSVTICMTSLPKRETVNNQLESR